MRCHLEFRRNEIECGSRTRFFRCLFRLSHRYTRSTICDEWYFALASAETNKEQTTENIGDSNSTTGTLRKSFNIFFFCVLFAASREYLLGKFEAECRFSLTARTAFFGIPMNPNEEKHPNKYTRAHAHMA